MPKLVPVVATSLSTGKRHTFKSMTHAAREGGFERSCIHDVLKGFRPSHAGFTFEIKGAVTQSIKSECNQYHRIANALNEGMTRKEAAEHLGIATNTIKSKMAIIRRMGLLNQEVRA